MNRKADIFTKRIDSHNESNQIANWNAVLADTVVLNALQDVHDCFDAVEQFRWLRNLLRLTVVHHHPDQRPAHTSAYYYYYYYYHHHYTQDNLGKLGLEMQNQSGFK